MSTSNEISPAEGAQNDAESTADAAAKPAAAAQDTAAGQDASPPGIRRWGSLTAALLIMVGSITLGVVIRVFNLFGDFGLANVLLLIFTFLGVLAPVTWLSLFACRGWKRLLPHTVLLLLMAAPFIPFKIREVGGEMAPIFALRFAPDPDETLEIPPQTADQDAVPRVDLTTTTANDFPRFLGPGGKQHVEHVRLRPNWENYPPQLIWRQPIGAGWSAFAAVNGFAITMEQRGPQELVTCYDVETGELLWSHGIEARYQTVLGGIGPRATPTIHEGKVYANGATGVLRCLDGATGELLWQVDLLEALDIPPEYDAKAVAYGRSNSPLVYDNMVVVPGGAGPKTQKLTEDATTLVAFNKETGQLLWRGGHEQIGYASPVLTTLDGVRQVVSVNESSVSGHDALDGRELWKFPWPGSSSTESNNSQPVPLGDNRIFVSKAYGVGSAVFEVEQTPSGKWTAEVVWHEPTLLKTKFTNVVVDDGYIYGLSDGILECVEAATGRRMWKKGRFHQGQILGVGDVLLVMDETSGEVSMVDMTPRGYENLGTFAALESNKVWNHLALYGKHLLVRDAQTAACWELPTKP